MENICLPCILIILIRRMDLVALKATSCTNQLLVKSEESFINFEYVIVSLLNEILYDHICFVGTRQCKTSLFQHFFDFCQWKF